MELFHITKRHFIPQILQEGLQPKLGERSSQCEAEEAIFLFHSLEDLEDAVMNWLGEELGEDVSLGVLKVTLPDAWERDIFIDSAVGYEAVCKAPIPPEFIKEYDTDVEP